MSSYAVFHNLFDPDPDLEHCLRGYAVIPQGQPGDEVEAKDGREEREVHLPPRVGNICTA